MGSLDTLDRIVLLMNEKNYNQQILTDYLGVDKSIFSTWKNGKSKSYMKYLPQIAGLFGVTIDWLVGSTRYRQEGLAEIYKWNISCVEGFDPVFDFGPLFKPYREKAGISAEEMGKHIGLSENLYTIRENGEWPFLYADALKCCQLIDITPQSVLESAGKLSGKPVTEPNTIVQPIESAAERYENSGENDTIYLELNERLRLRQNFVYFAIEKLETLKVALDNAGTSPQFLDSLNRDGNLLVNDIRLAAEYFGIDAEFALKYDLTRKTGRFLAKWFEQRKYDSSKLTCKSAKMSVPAKYGAMLNIKIAGEISLSGVNIGDGYDYTNGGAFMTVVYEVKGGGSTSPSYHWEVACRASDSKNLIDKKGKPASGFKLSSSYKD